jgi:hypothetical protein
MCKKPQTFRTLNITLITQDMEKKKHIKTDINKRKQYKTPKELTEREKGSIKLTSNKALNIKANESEVKKSIWKPNNHCFPTASVIN